MPCVCRRSRRLTSQAPARPDGEHGERGAARSAAASLRSSRSIRSMVMPTETSATTSPLASSRTGTTARIDGPSVPAYSWVKAWPSRRVADVADERACRSGRGRGGCSGSGPAPSPTTKSTPASARTRSAIRLDGRRSGRGVPSAARRRGSRRRLGATATARVGGGGRARRAGRRTPPAPSATTTRTSDDQRPAARRIWRATEGSRLPSADPCRALCRRSRSPSVNSTTTTVTRHSGPDEWRDEPGSARRPRPWRNR